MCAKNAAAAATAAPAKCGSKHSRNSLNMAQDSPRYEPLLEAGNAAIARARRESLDAGAPIVYRDEHGRLNVPELIVIAGPNGLC